MQRSTFIAKRFPTCAKFIYSEFFHSTKKQFPRTYYSVSEDKTEDRIERLLKIKAASGKSFSEIAQALGLTNVYTAQLFLGQAKLTVESGKKLKKLLPDVSDDDLHQMQTSFPMRNFDDEILKEWVYDKVDVWNPESLN